MVARSADAIFFNGRIRTFDPKVKSARAIAVSDGRIVAVGSDSDVKGSAPRGCDKMDLGGRTVVPGFIDSHTHFINMGIDSMNVDLMNTKSLEEAMAKMAGAAKKTPEGEWIIGAGWMESRWGGVRFITRDDLDRCCPKNPAVAHRICGHLSTLNSKAITELGLSKDIPDVEKNADGELSGIVTESAVTLVRKATAPDTRRKIKGLHAAIKRAHMLGVTSVQDNGEVDHFGIYQDAEKRGKLAVRVWFNVPSDSLESMLRLGIRTGLGSDLLRIGGLKIFCDGALGARSAALSEPYVDDPGNKGMFVHDRNDFTAMVSQAHEHGVQLAIHAIGDEGIEVTLKAMESAIRFNPRKNHRHRIEHLELPHASQLRRMKRAGIIASMQPNFVGEWGGINGMYDARLGPVRAKKNNPFKEVRDNNVHLAFGSDCMPFNPLYGVRSAVEAPYDAQKLTVEQALLAYTRDAAYASFDEDAKGTISPGKLADFVVLSGDPITDPKALGSISVLKTVLGGDVVYDRARPGR